jgi:thrombospondin type 3 repeat protein
MKTKCLPAWTIRGLFVCSLALTVNQAVAALTTNSWSDGSSKWELGVKWSAGVPSLADTIDLISGGIPVGPRTITIDADTVASNAINSCLTVNNVTVTGSAMAPNTLFLNNANNPPGPAPLTVLGNLDVLIHGGLSITNSRVIVEGAPGASGGLYIDGGFGILQTDSLLFTTNAYIGNTTFGNFTMSGGTWDSATLYIGVQGGSQGTLTISGGTLTINDAVPGSPPFILGAGFNATGTVWMTGGQVNVTNNSISLGFPGVGQMTISNGTFTIGDLDVGDFGGQGTFTLAGGTVTVQNSGLIIIGHSSTNAAMWLTGGELNTTAGTSVFVGDSGTGQMTVSNAVWLASDIGVGQQFGDLGTLTVAGGTITTPDSLDIGTFGGSGTVWLVNGSISVNSSLTVSEGAGVGQLTVSNGTLQAVFLDMNGLGTLTVAGGTSTILNLTVSDALQSTSEVWMTGGQLTVGDSVVGGAQVGQMTISNGTWNTSTLVVGNNGGAEGTLTMAGGTTTLSSTFDIGEFASATGAVWLTGGQLTTTNSEVLVGFSGVGRMTASSGKWDAMLVGLGIEPNSQGTLIISGTQVTVTNGFGRIVVGNTGTGQMSVLGGAVLAQTMLVGNFNSPQGELTMGNGSMTILSNVTVGDCFSNGFGTVEMSGGTLYVTNAAHNAVLEVQNGYFFLDGGSLVVDKLVITNGCSAFFEHNGGTLSVGTLILDPNGDADGDGLPNGWEQAHGLDPLSPNGNNGPDGDPDGDGFNNLQEYLAGSDPQNPLSTPLQITPPPFAFTSIQRSNNNIVLNWTTVPGWTNQLQASPIASSNGFINLGPQMFITTTATNYTDIGGATNKPARFYRIRLVP